MDDFFEFLKKNKKFVDSIIKKHVPEKWDDKYLEWLLGKPSYTYDSVALTKSLAEPMWDFLNRGGKRWRPVMFLLFTEALGGNMEKASDIAIIPELVHEGSIMVDDVEDLGEMRRGKPCTHKIFGVDIAINTGNMMYYIPLIILIKNIPKLDDETRLRMYNIYTQEMINLSAGQAMDIWWHKGKASNVTEKQYMQMCAYKTGTLARMAARLAVALSKGTDEQEEKIGKIAETFGVAFQIHDDILSATSKEFSDKKGYGDDITEGKRSLMVVHALHHASKEERSELLSILDSHTRDKEKIDRAIEILVNTGSVEHAKKTAKEIMSNAWEGANVIPDSPAKKNIKRLVDYLIERTI
ncbi:MAG: polyprenyl synthetase family protein [Candidatus Aenigmatarchaeota archaeon]|nr:polyprenyl synthetase family protein [Nanoarchaeota archaeon]